MRTVLLRYRYLATPIAIELMWLVLWGFVLDNGPLSLEELAGGGARHAGWMIAVQGKTRLLI